MGNHTQSTAVYLAKHNHKVVSCLVLLVILFLPAAGYTANASDLDEPSVTTKEYEPDWRVEVERFPDFDGELDRGVSIHFQPIHRETDMAVAPDGSIYLLCNIDRTNRDPSQRDILLVKYNAKGERQWYETIGSEHQNDDGECVGVDRNGNVYVAGALGREGFVAVYSPNGRKLWSHIEKDLSVYTAIAFSGDSVYLTGLTTARISPDAPRRYSNGDMLISRFRLDGRKIWSKQFQVEPDERLWGLGIAVFDNRRVYVTGVYDKPSLESRPMGSVNNEQIVLFCLDSDGNRRWGREIGIDPALERRDRRGDIDLGVDVVVDSAGNVYVAGQSTSPLARGLPDDEHRAMPTLLKFTSEGERVWARQIAAPWGRIRMKRATITRDDRILIAGSVRPNRPYMHCMAVLEYDTEGNLTHVLRSENRDAAAESVRLVPRAVNSTGGDEPETTRMLICGMAARNNRAPDFDNRPLYYFLMQIGGFQSMDDEPETSTGGE